MRPITLVILTTLGIALPAWADTSNQALSPDMLRLQEQAVLREQQRLEQEAGGRSLAEKRSVLIHDCQTRVGRQSLYPGRVDFDSPNIIEEKRVYITGTAEFPDSKGEPQPWHYECVLDADKKKVESVSVKPASR